jgi:hypothetical protein
MAADGKSPVAGDDAAVARRIADLSRKLDEVSVAASGAKTVGRVMTILIALVAVFSVFRIVLPFDNIRTKPELYTKALVEQFNASVYPKLQEEIDESIKKTGPVVQKIATDKIEKRGPEVVRALDTEAKILLESMKGYGEDVWANRIGALNDKIYDRIADKMPELADKDKAEVIVGNAHQAVTGAMERLIAEHMKDHVEAITSIQTEIANFPVPSNVKEMSDEELKSAFMDLISTYSMTTLKGGLTPQTKAFLADLGSQNTEEKN